MKKYFVNVLFMLSTQLYAWELPKNVIYIHPKPGAEDVAWKTGLILRVDPALQDQLDLNDFSFTVTGTRSGKRSGKKVLSGNNVLFQLNNDYEPGEYVDVVITSTSLGWTEPYSYRFSVNELTNYWKYDVIPIDDDPITPPSLKKTNAYDIQLVNGVAVPSDFPVFETEILKEEKLTPGKIFITTVWDYDFPYFMILEPDGTPYYYQRISGDTRGFQIQENGELSRQSGNDFIIMDSTCTEIRRVSAANGYQTDEHELQILADGHFFLIAYGNHIEDMSKVVSGGQKNASLKDTHIQEFDENGNLIFEWLSHEYLDVEGATHTNLRGQRIDYSHMNSLAIDYDGHIIASIRHFSEVIKINRQTGDIIWRLGGEFNEFEFLNDDHMLSFQHDARPVPGYPNHYTAFDNGNNHRPRFSRAVEFAVDVDAMTATKVWEYRLPSNRGASGMMGNAQRLPNGNTHICWADGGVPKATEVTPDGEVVYQGDFVGSWYTYRSFKYDWEYASDKTELVAEPMPYHINLIFNRFGDKTVKEYKIFAGKIGQSLIQIGTTTNNWYQVKHDELDNNTTYNFRVKAVHENGLASKSSNTETVAVSFIDPNANMVINGDFGEKMSSWNWDVTGGASATRAVTNGEFKFKISNGGSEIYHIQSTQPNIPLLKGVTYLFEFDAYADQSRSFDARVAQDGGSYINYSQTSGFWLSTRKKHFSHEFTMQDASDTRARIVLNAGDHEADVYVDNVTLKAIGGLAVEKTNEQVIADFKLEQNYPNPFNPLTTIEYTVPSAAHVQIDVFNVLGEHVQTLVKKNHVPGNYKTVFDGSMQSSGLYFYELNATLDNGDLISKVTKMTLLK